MALLIRHDGPVEEVFPASKQEGFTAEEFYTLIGGGCDTFEVVYLSAMEGSVLVIDENGKATAAAHKNPRFNAGATSLLRSGNHIEGDWITGNALLCADGVEIQ